MYFKINKTQMYILFTAILVVCILFTTKHESRQMSANPVYTLVIDAGHGGEDGGAVAADGTLESEINLDIALRLEALACFWGLDPVMTRSQSIIEYPSGADTLSAMKKADQNARISLIQETPGAVVISIHQNYYPSPTPRGIQVFYGHAAESKLLADITQNNLTSQLLPNNHRVASAIDSNIYLMRKISCPAILVECGFLSNSEELAKLKTENYRTELAAVILASHLQYTKGIST